MTASDTNIPVGPTVAAAEALTADSRIIFDFEGARRAGASTESIARYLTGEAGLDYVTEQRAGKSDDEIINEIAVSRMPSRGMSTVEGISRGAVGARMPGVKNAVRYRSGKSMGGNR